MNLPTTYTGDTWEKLRVQLVYAFDAANGRVKVNGMVYPQVTNAQALSIAAAYRKLLRTTGAKVPAFWPELWYRALGRFQEGDRFLMTTAHGDAVAPPEVVAAVWELAAHASGVLDQSRAQPKLLVLDLSYRAYEATAKLAYAQLLADRKAKKKKPIKVPNPADPGGPPGEIDPDKIPKPPRPGDGLPAIPSMRGIGLLVLLIIAALAVDKKGR